MRFSIWAFALLIPAVLSAQATITTLAGTGSPGNPVEGAVALGSPIYHPQSVHADHAGNVYFRERTGIWKITPAGILVKVAGGSGSGYSGDGGPARDAQISSTGHMSTDLHGNLFLADPDNGRVRKVTADGKILTVAGRGFGSGLTGDGGPAVEASVIAPSDVALDAAGNLYIAEQSGQRIRKVTPAGTISTVAGTGVMGTVGGEGDGGPATAAKLRFPASLAIDAAGNLYFTEGSFQRIRRVTPAGIISTFAGNGENGASGDGGPATAARLGFPFFLRIDAAGNLLITEYANSRIRRVSPGGIISTFAGNGNYGFSGDYGPPLLATLNVPRAAAPDAAGNVYIADTVNIRIRKVASTPTPMVSLKESGAIAVSGVSPTITARFTHPGGLANVGVVNVLINRELNGNGACYLAWSHPQQLLYLVNDGGPSSGLTAGLALGSGAATVSNSQCTVYANGSSISTSGGVAALTVAVAFKPAFTGNKVIYLAGRDVREATVGWQTQGVAMIPEPVLTYPRVAGMTPAAGDSPAPLLSFTFQDAANAATGLRTVWVLANNVISGARGCYLAYSVVEDRLYLYPSEAGKFLTNKALTDSGTLEDNQCRVTLAGSSVVKSGNQLTLNLQMTFSPYFAGAQGIWGAVETTGGTVSPWTILGSWMVPGISH